MDRALHASTTVTPTPHQTIGSVCIVMSCLRSTAEEKVSARNALPQTADKGSRSELQLRVSDTMGSVYAPAVTFVYCTPNQAKEAERRYLRLRLLHKLVGFWGRISCGAAYNLPYATCGALGKRERRTPKKHMPKPQNRTVLSPLMVKLHEGVGKYCMFEHATLQAPTFGVRYLHPPLTPNFFSIAPTRSLRSRTSASLLANWW